MLSPYLLQPYFVPFQHPRILCFHWIHYLPRLVLPSRSTGTLCDQHATPFAHACCAIACAHAAISPRARLARCRDAGLTTSGVSQGLPAHACRSSTPAGLDSPAPNYTRAPPSIACISHVYRGHAAYTPHLRPPLLNTMHGIVHKQRYKRAGQPALTTTTSAPRVWVTCHCRVPYTISLAASWDRCLHGCLPACHLCCVCRASAPAPGHAPPRHFHTALRRLLDCMLGFAPPRPLPGTARLCHVPHPPFFGSLTHFTLGPWDCWAWEVLDTLSLSAAPWTHALTALWALPIPHAASTAAACVCCRLTLG